MALSHSVRVAQACMFNMMSKPKQNYGLHLGPEYNHNLETVSSETTKFEFSQPGGTNGQAAE